MIKPQRLTTRAILRSLFFLFLLGTIFTSCVPTRKMIYFQKLSQSDSLEEQIKYDRQYYKLQPNDIINIDVRTLDDKYDQVFNLKQGVGSVSGNLLTGGDYYYLYGYPLDDSGFVHVPLIGQIQLSGLTVEEAQKLVSERISNILVDAFVTIRLGGLRYSILGEVRRPGKYTLMQNQVTIYEAVANAGDLTDVAKRDEVILVRQYPTGTKLHKLNMLDERIVGSPYYFLQPNDLIYIQPLKVKSFGIGTYGFQSFTAVLAAATSVLLIINVLK